MAASLAGFSLLVGCGSHGKYERVVLTGSVSYQGEAIDNGRITVRPKPGTSAPPMAGAYIIDGQYCIDHKGGVPVGSHWVAIEAFRHKPDVRQDPTMPGAGMIQFLPDKFNSETELELIIATGNSTMQQNFELE